MKTLDAARWERLSDHHDNWIPGAEAMFGLYWAGDPGRFMHRALVFFWREEWRMHAWGNMQPHVCGDWIDCGVYKSKLEAMRSARNMAKLFEAMREEDDDE